MTNANPDEAVVPIPITRTELVWPGKYNPDGTLKEPPRVHLPFQVIERVNETRATREARKEPQELSLFDVWEGDEGDTFDDGWRNKLIWGDNLLVMGSLLENLAGKIDLIYIDPPFATGADFSLRVPIGESSSLEVFKEPTLIEEKVYRDTWGYGLDSYLDMIRQRLVLMRELLTDTGSIWVHLAWHVGHYVKTILDEVFGRERFVNEVVWRYGKMSNATRRFPQNHDILFLYSKTDNYFFRPVKAADSEYKTRFSRYLTGNQVTYSSVKHSTDKLILGRISKTQRELGRALHDDDVLFDFDVEFKTQDDVFYDISIVKGNAEENLNFDTQKPEKLLERIIAATCPEGGLVADFFMGSGTAAAAAEKTGRRWVACDLSRFAIHVTRKRLLEIEDAQSFEILNLGKYERQYWQGVTFGESQTLTQRALFEYLAFILRLYGAEPVSGLAHLHGKKGKAMVHIGSVDSPVTIDEIDQAINECAALEQAELHILGWEWEMGLYELMVEEAKKRGVKLLLLQIPREVMEQQAADKGDVQFFELAHLEFDVNLDGRTASVTLTDFVIPNTELIPEEVRDKIDKWSDYIDYWAIDWDFRDDTFMQGWVTYRTKKNRKLELSSDPHTYQEPGAYTIVVKVIDVFGNDTSQAYELQAG